MVGFLKKKFANLPIASGSLSSSSLLLCPSQSRVETSDKTAWTVYHRHLRLSLPKRSSARLLASINREDQSRACTEPWQLPTTSARASSPSWTWRRSWPPATTRAASPAPAPAPPVPCAGVPGLRVLPRRQPRRAGRADGARARAVGRVLRAAGRGEGQGPAGRGLRGALPPATRGSRRTPLTRTSTCWPLTLSSASICTPMSHQDSGQIKNSRLQ